MFVNSNVADVAWHIGQQNLKEPERDFGRKAYATGNVRIGVLIAFGITTCNYTYDFGDDWQHSIAVEVVADANSALEYPAPS